MKFKAIPSSSNSLSAEGASVAVQFEPQEVSLVKKAFLETVLAAAATGGTQVKNVINYRSIDGVALQGTYDVIGLARRFLSVDTQELARVRLNASSLCVLTGVLVTFAASGGFYDEVAAGGHIDDLDLDVTTREVVSRGRIPEFDKTGEAVELITALDSARLHLQPYLGSI